MGGLAPGKLKSRRGWHSSPRRLHSAIPLFDPGFKNSLQEKLYQLYGAGDILIAIDSRRRGPLWSAKMAHSLTAADSFQTKERVHPLGNGVFLSFIGSNPILSRLRPLFRDFVVRWYGNPARIPWKPPDFGVLWEFSSLST